MKSAIILGATGLTGNYVLNKLLKKEDYSKVIVFSRRELDIKHEKLEVIVCDLLNLEEQKDYFKADEIYVCIDCEVDLILDMALNTECKKCVQ